MAVTYLQLAPEQGGIRFGPFQGMVNIGTDPRRCQIRLDAVHGIYPLHATLVFAAGGTYHFAPAELEAKCFVVQQGSPQVWPVQGAVELSTGDTVVLGTPGGPRFLIMGEPAGTAPGGQGPAGGIEAGGAGQGWMATLGGMFGAQHTSRRNQNMSQGISQEIGRRFRSRLLTQSPFREMYQISTRMRTGTLFNPVYIGGAIFTVIGMLGAGTVSCSGLGYSLWRQMMH